MTPAKSIVERVETEIPYLDSLELSLTERANHLIDLELPHGATAFRTHVDVEPMTDLRYFDEVRCTNETICGRNCRLSTARLTAFRFR